MPLFFLHQCKIFTANSSYEFDRQVEVRDVPKLQSIL
jgi:hypothetical protein